MINDFNNSIKNRKITEAIVYLLKKSAKTMDKYHIVKLLFLADKVHLAKYARTITRDNFVAMKYGPVGSRTKDLLNEYQKLPEKDLNFFRSLIIRPQKNTYALAVDISDYPFKSLSSSDRKILDLIYDKFHDLAFESLTQLTHKYPEWKKHEKAVKTGGRKPISTADLLEQPVFEMTPEQIQLCKDTFIC